jgi:transcriptional regulator with XRE-family HTH domain
MKTLREKLDALPENRRKKIARRTNALIAEEMTMRELRKARQVTQVEMAKALGVKQEQVSRIEKRTDLHISTLRRSIEALGGELSLVAKFPNREPVRLTGFAEIES